MSDHSAKFVLWAALLVQAAGFLGLLIFDASSSVSSIAFWTVIGAGFVEVALAVCAKLKGNEVNS